MNLFDVEGWSLSNNIVKSNEDKDRKSKNKQRKKAKTLNSIELQALVSGSKVNEEERRTGTKHKRGDGDGDGQTGADKKKKRIKSVEKGAVEEDSRVESGRVKSDQVESEVESTKITPKNKSAKVTAESKLSDVSDAKSSAKATAKVKTSDSRPTDSKKLTPLQQKMMEKLSGSRFRWINEQLYTTNSDNALSLMSKDKDMFDEYHKGFRSQVQSWPENPVDTMVKQFKLRIQKPLNAPGGLSGNGPSGNVVVADMGCGEAQLAADLAKVKGIGKNRKIHFTVHSFDLAKPNDRVTIADIKHVPLEDHSVDVVVFCLALMGTNFLDFIQEAFRLLKPRGEVWIAEIKSRFVDNDYQAFVEKLKSLGLFHRTTDDSNTMFVRFEFFKPPRDILAQRQRKQEERSQRKKFVEEEEEKDEGKWVLKPCIYKRR